MARIRNRDRDRKNLTEEEKQREAEEARARGETPRDPDDAGEGQSEPENDGPESQSIDDEKTPGTPPPLGEMKPRPGSSNEPGDLSDPEEQKKAIRYHMEEAPAMREQMKKDQAKDAQQFEENAMRDEAEKIEQQRGKAPHPDDAGAVLDQPVPKNARDREQTKQQERSGPAPHPDDAGAVLDEPAPKRRERDRDRGIDMDM